MAVFLKTLKEIPPDKQLNQDIPLDTIYVNIFTNRKLKKYS